MAAKLSDNMQRLYDFAVTNGEFTVTFWGGRAYSPIPVNATLATLNGLVKRGLLRERRTIGTFERAYSVTKRAV